MRDEMSIRSSASLRIHKHTHTVTRDGEFSTSFIPLVVVVVVVVVTAVVQFRASVIVVCIHYFDKTFIYEKPRQWKHYRMWNPCLLEWDGCKGIIMVWNWGWWKGCVKMFPSTPVVILLLFFICYNKAIAGCWEMKAASSRHTVYEWQMVEN